MKLSLLHPLPFHRQLLQHVESAASLSGVLHSVAVHTPASPHDFLQRSPTRGETLSMLHGSDVIVVADYPVDFIREAYPDAVVVGTRHSLASRNNTWMPEWAECDYIVTWSAWDEAEFRRRDVLPRKGFLRCGCVWAPMVPLGVVRSPQLTALWCPTWNADLSRRAEVAAELDALKAAGWNIRVRPHPVIRWREPEVVADWSTRFDVVPLDEDIMESIAGCDVLISDVSGAGLSGLLLPGGGPPVVWVEPPTFSHPQIDMGGPEWSMRDMVGTRISSPPHDLYDACVRIEWTSDHPRESPRRIILGPNRVHHPADILVDTLRTMHRDGSL